jgi:hypothetical protein
VRARRRHDGSAEKGSDGGGGGAALCLIVLTAVVLRIALLSHILATHPDYLVQDREQLETAIRSTEAPYINDFGYEASNIAHAWVCRGQGFASPFGGATGPTAWIAPGIVAIYAISFALWGCFTPSSILFAYALALLGSAVATVAVFRTGALVAGKRSTGLLAAAAFALLPYEAWTFHTSSQLDFNLEVLCFAVLLLQVLRVVAEPRRSGSALAVTAAVAALFNPGFLLCTAVGALLALPDRSPRNRLRLLLRLAVAHLLVLGPYVAWQSARLGALVPVKSNAPVELLIGNTDTASGLLRHEVFLAHHPSQNETEYRRYRDLGEAAYVADARSRFLQSFDLGDFAADSVRRCYEFFLHYELKPWDDSPGKVAMKQAFWGLFFLAPVALVVVRRGRPRRLETAALLLALAYAAPFLATGIMERYRIPLTPVVAVALAVLLIEGHHRLRPRTGP